VHLPTPTVFQSLTDAERGPRDEKGVLWWRQQLASGRLDPALLFNRLTGPAIRLCPSVADLLLWCQKYDYPYLMSGSGAACFILGHMEAPPNTSAGQTPFVARDAQLL
jgi:4-diphosphocytidyl-2C-methyl-D-erythritol kinase